MWTTATTWLWSSFPCTSGRWTGWSTAVSKPSKTQKTFTTTDALDFSCCKDLKHPWPYVIKRIYPTSVSVEPEKPKSPEVDASKVSWWSSHHVSWFTETQGLDGVSTWLHVVILCCLIWVFPSCLFTERRGSCYCWERRGRGSRSPSKNSQETYVLIIIKFTSTKQSSIDDANWMRWRVFAE